MKNQYKDALVKKLAIIFVQLHKDGEMESHVASQVRILESLILEEELEKALEQAQLVYKNSKVLSSVKISNMVFDIKSSLKDLINAEKGEELNMRNVYDDAQEVRKEVELEAQQAKKPSIKEGNVDLELKCDSAPSEIKVSVKGIKIKAHGNELELESLELEGSADISNFAMMLKGMMSKK